MNPLSKLAIATALVLGVSAPLAAAPWNGGKGLDEKIAQLEQRVKDAKDAGSLTETKATELEKAVAGLETMHTNFSKGGIDRQEQSTLEDRIEKVRQLVDRALG